MPPVRKPSTSFDCATSSCSVTSLTCSALGRVWTGSTGTGARSTDENACRKISFAVAGFPQPTKSSSIWALRRIRR